jgi:hypothetical protein
MRKVDRVLTGIPPSLTGARRAGPLELERARRFYAKPRQYTNKGKLIKFPFGAYKGDDVRHLLEKLFFGKCAYCEGRYDVTGPVDVEHYRPKAGVEGEPAHRGYWWLAASWSNLLPSCLDCNRRRRQPTPATLASLSSLHEKCWEAACVVVKTGKDTCFPVSGPRVSLEPAAGTGGGSLDLEQPILLNPCEDEPGEHLRYLIDRGDPLGLVYPAPDAPLAVPVLPPLSTDPLVLEAHARAVGVSVRGAVSIQVFGLNRLRLLQERTRVLRNMEFLGATIVDLSGVIDRLEAYGAGGATVVAIDEAVLKLRATVGRLLAEINSCARPEAPFSSMAAEWIAVFRRDLAAAPVAP